MIPILPVGSRISQAHYAEVTRGASRSPMDDASDNFRTKGAKRSDALFAVVEAPAKRTILGVEEDWYTAKCKLVTLDADRAARSGSADNADYYVYFPNLQEALDFQWQAAGVLTIKASFCVGIGGYVAQWHPTSRWAFVNETISYNTEGECIWPDPDSGSLSSVYANAEGTFQADNPFLGKLIAGTKVRVDPLIHSGDSEYRWTISPMPLWYRCVAESNIPAGGSGDADIYVGSNPTGELITVGNRWMHGNTQISQGKQLIATWEPREESFLVTGAECE